jgi:hypothetical protein
MKRLSASIGLAALLALVTAINVDAKTTTIKSSVTYSVKPATSVVDFSAVVDGTVKAAKGCRSGRSITVDGSRAVGPQVFAAPSVTTRSAANGSFTATLEMTGGSGSYQYVVRVAPKTIKKKGIRCAPTLFDLHPAP